MVLDASYSYGSFNTHKSYVNFGQTFKTDSPTKSMLSKTIRIMITT